LDYHSSHCLYLLRASSSPALPRTNFARTNSSLKAQMHELKHY
jgi:hypothetical protein